MKIVKINKNNNSNYEKDIERVKKLFEEYNGIRTLEYVSIIERMRNSVDNMAEVIRTSNYRDLND